MGDTTLKVNYAAMTGYDLAKAAKETWSRFSGQVPEHVRAELGPIFEALIEKVEEIPDTS
jgi:hypothetical protein